MTPNSDLYELLYISSIAPAASISVVPRIAKHARERNAKLDVTGLLIFDGARFCQHLEGSESVVRALYARIEVDPRHTQVIALQQGASPTRRFPRFSMGYADLAELDSLQLMVKQSSKTARETFNDLLPTVDMEP